MQYFIESYADKIFAQLRAKMYDGATRDMLYEFLSDNTYSGALADMWKDYITDNGILNYTHDEYIAGFNLDTILLGRWLLATGTWNDNGYWVDTAVWSD